MQKFLSNTKITVADISVHKFTAQTLNRMMYQSLNGEFEHRRSSKIAVSSNEVLTIIVPSTSLFRPLNLRSISACPLRLT